VPKIIVNNKEFHDFASTDGFRTSKEQQALFNGGKNVTGADGVKHKSRHQDGKAIDLYPFKERRKAFAKGNVESKKYSDFVYEVIKEGIRRGIVIESGRNWYSREDSPHLEIYKPYDETHENLYKKYKAKPTTLGEDLLKI